MANLLSKKEVCKKLSVSAATLSRWEEAKSMNFPKRFHIGNGGKWSKAFWREDEVDAWIDLQTGVSS